MAIDGNRCRTRSRIHSSPLWSVELPLGWSSSEESECTSFCGHPILGILQASAVQKPDGEITQADIMEFAEESQAHCICSKTVHTDRYFGTRCESERSGISWTEWWLAWSSTLVYFTYNVPAVEKTREIGQFPDYRS